MAFPWADLYIMVWTIPIVFLDRMSFYRAFGNGSRRRVRNGKNAFIENDEKESVVLS